MYVQLVHPPTYHLRWKKKKKKKMDDPTGSLTVTASFYIRKKKSFSSLLYEVVHQPSSNRQHTITPPTTTTKYYKKRGETFFSTFKKLATSRDLLRAFSLPRVCSTSTRRPGLFIFFLSGLGLGLGSCYV